MTTRSRLPGEFCWINILTSKTADERDFFAKLLGWNYAEIPGMGHRVQVGGRDIGGLFDVASPQTPPGTPPGIGVMVKVDNADATCAKVTSLGGTAKPAFDIGEQGRMAECVDPTGAMFDLWQPKKSHGMDVDGATIGAPGWFEELTADGAKAQEFYSALFGWRGATEHMPNGAYTSFNLGDTPVAGMLEMPGIPPHWKVYFTVKDADASMRDAVQLGGSIWMPAFDVTNIGRCGGVTSPQGVHFYVIHYLHIQTATA